MYDDELDRFKRDINLSDFATRCYGYSRLGSKSTARSDMLWNKDTHDKIVIGRGDGGHWIYWSVRDTNDNGTIIDFVQRRGTPSLGEVRKELRSFLRIPPPPQPPRGRPRDLKPIVRDRDAVLRALENAREHVNSSYLNERGLLPKTLSDPKFAGTWKLDARNNVLFPHRDDAGVTGYEIKNRGFTGFAAGGIKTLWQSVATDTDRILVIAESAIDAMSYYQLRRIPADGARFVSTAGGLSPLQLEVLTQAIARLPSGGIVLAAVDADPAGDNFAEQFKSIVAERKNVCFLRDSPDRSVAKDWNDVVRIQEREFIQSALRTRSGQEASRPTRHRDPGPGMERSR